MDDDDYDDDDDDDDDDFLQEDHGWMQAAVESACRVAHHMISR